MPTALTVEGLTAVVQALHEAAEEVDDLAAPLDRIAEHGATRAAAYAPKRTRRLATSLRGTRDGLRASVATSVTYAWPVNSGSVKRRIRPTLFLQRAEADVEPYAVQQLQDHVSDLIRRKF